MKTYAESIGEPSFDWNEFVDRDPKSITENEWENAIKLSSNWPTCACGNQCSIIPRCENGAPKDDIIRRTGTLFYYFIRNKDLKSAKEILVKIEERASELIKEILNAKTKTLRK